MIFIRRILAVLVGIVFFAVFTLGIVRSHVADTFFNSAYVSKQLVRLDVYNWVHDSVLPAVVADEVSTGIEIDGDFLPGDATTVQFADQATTQRTILNLARGTVPPEYLQEFTEGFLDGFLPYVQGETDEFAVALGLRGRVVAFFPSARRAIADMRLSETLVNELVAPAAERSAADFTAGPLGVTLTGQQARDAALRIAPPDWIDAQILDAMDQAEAYLTGRSLSMNIRVPLADRLPIAADVIKDILAEGQADQLLFDRVILPRIREQIGSVTVLSYEVPISDAEINDAVRQIAPRRWVQGHVNGIVDATAAYLSRETDDLTYAVDMRARKAAAVDIIGDLAVRKLREQISSIPRCSTRADLAEAGIAAQQGDLPPCIPPQGTNGFLEDAVTRVRGDVRAQIGARFPDTMRYSLNDFSAGLTGRGVTELQEVRDTIHDGITYTDQDLRDEFGEDLGTFDRWLDVIRNGRPYTSVDWENDLTESDSEDFDSFDTARGYLGLALGTEGGALVLGVALLLMAVIGILGGRMWSTRLAWAAGALTLSALVLVVVASQILPGPVRDRAWDESINQINQQIAEDRAAGEPVQLLIVMRDEGIPKAEEFTTSWVSGLGDAALLWLFVGLLGMAVGWAWWYYTRAQRVTFETYV
jgi:hypothetical protein